MSTASLTLTADLHTRIIGPKVGVDYYSGAAAAAGHAGEGQDSITEMEYYKSHWLEGPSTRVGYQDPVGHNERSSCSKLGEKVKELLCPVCDGLNEDKYRYLKQIQQRTSRKNYQHKFDG